jgi:hypothetical protein
MTLGFADLLLASLLSRHTPEGAWIPVFRPYTPVSENGELLLLGRFSMADQYPQMYQAP